jgi:hypothetical protein
MTMNRRTICTWLFILLASVASLAQTTTQFDKFKNQTFVKTKQTQAGNVAYTEGNGKPQVSIGVAVGFICDGQVDGCKPTGRNIELMFLADSAGMRFDKLRDVILLIDGKAHSLGKASWDYVSRTDIDADGDIVDESLDSSIDMNLLTALAKAKVVEVQIGIYQFTLSDDNLAAFRDIATHLK